MLPAFPPLRARELDPSVDVAVVVADAYPNFAICHKGDMSPSAAVAPALLLTQGQDHCERLAAGQPFRDPPTRYPFGQVLGPQTLSA
jgi:hypothetical protein